MSARPRFGAEYATGAAPEAMRCHLAELRDKRAAIDRDIRRIELLLVERCRQIQHGEWPPEPVPPFGPTETVR